MHVTRSKEPTCGVKVCKKKIGVTPLIKKSMSESLLRCVTQDMLQEKYPPDHWIRAFTDGSASEAIRGRGAGIYIEWPDNTSSSISVPTGKYSTNYKAEAEALQEAARVFANSEAKWFY